MRVKEIIDEFTKLKNEITPYCDKEESYIQKRVKSTTNLLLNLLECLTAEVEE